jgi:hypothetical protein
MNRSGHSSALSPFLSLTLRTLRDRGNFALLVVFLAVLPGIFWGLPSAITPQDDAPVPLGSLLFFSDYLKSHKDITYPAFHQILLLPPCVIALGIYWIMGGISHISSSWPYGMHDPTGFFSALIIITNLVSALMGVALLKTACPQMEKSRAWAWFALLLIGTNGVFVYYSRVGNLDLPYNFWWALCWLGLWRHLIEKKPFRSGLLLAGITAGCAIASKDQAVGLAAGAGLLLLLFSPQPSSTFRDRIRQSCLFGVALLITYLIAAVLPQPMRWWNHARFVVSPHAPTSIPFTLSGEVQILWTTLNQLSAVFTTPTLLLCVVGSIALFRSQRGQRFWLLALPLIGYYLIIAKTRVVYPRFMLPFMIPVLVLATHGVALIGGYLARWRLARLAWVGILLVLLVMNVVLSYAPVTYAQVFDLKRTLAAELPPLLPLGSPLLISHMQSYEYPNGGIYDRYRLMKLPNEPIVPASRHSSGIFKPLDKEVRYYLWGTGTSGLPSNTPLPAMPLQGDLVREWRYPDWVRNTVLVPCIFEFKLYRLRGPLPLDYVPPPFVTSGLTGG